MLPNSELTDKDKKDIYGTWKCRAKIGRFGGGKNPQRVLQVSSKRDDYVPQVDMTCAVKRALECIAKNAEAKNSRAPDGHPGRPPVPAGPTQPQTAMMSQQIMPYQQNRGQLMQGPPQMGPHQMIPTSMMGPHPTTSLQQQQAPFNYQMRAACLPDGHWRVQQAMYGRNPGGIPAFWTAHHQGWQSPHPGWHQPGHCAPPLPCAQQGSPPQQPAVLQLKNDAEPTAPEVATKPQDEPREPKPEQPAAQGVETEDQSDSYTSYSSSEDEPAPEAKPKAKAAPKVQRAEDEPPVSKKAPLPKAEPTRKAERAKVVPPDSRKVPKKGTEVSVNSESDDDRGACPTRRMKEVEAARRVKEAAKKETANREKEHSSKDSRGRRRSPSPARRQDRKRHKAAPDEKRCKESRRSAVPSPERQLRKRMKAAPWEDPVEDRRPPWPAEKDVERRPPVLRTAADASKKKSSDVTRKREPDGIGSSWVEPSQPWKKQKHQPTSEDEECTNGCRDRQSGKWSGKWSGGERWHQGKRWNQGDDKWGPPEDSWKESALLDLPTNLTRCSPPVPGLPQTLPRVNFYSWGRNGRPFPPEFDVHGGHNDRVSQYLSDAGFRIVAPHVFDVDHWNDLWANTHRWDWELDAKMLDWIGKHTVWRRLVQKVRPVLQTQLAQGNSLVNIVFVCSYGRQASVAAATLYGDWIGPPPCRS